MEATIGKRLGAGLGIPQPRQHLAARWTRIEERLEPSSIKDLLRPRKGGGSPDYLLEQETKIYGPEPS